MVSALPAEQNPRSSPLPEQEFSWGEEGAE
jgi:hypothetical protein